MLEEFIKFLQVCNSNGKCKLEKNLIPFLNEITSDLLGNDSLKYVASEISLETGNSRPKRCDSLFINDNTLYFIEYKVNKIKDIHEDIKNGIYKLIDHLIRLGHRRIVYVNNSFYPSVWTTRNYRFDGYVKAMTEHELLVDPRYIIPQNDTIEDVIKNIDKIFDSCTGKETPTAIYSDESVVAATIINHLKERGLKIPDDVSVVSSSDSTLAKMISPRLTAVGFDAYTFAMDSMNMILDLLNKNIGSTKIVELTLSERESTSKAINR